MQASNSKHKVDVAHCSTDNTPYTSITGVKRITLVCITASGVSSRVCSWATSVFPRGDGSIRERNQAFGMMSGIKQVTTTENK